VASRKREAAIAVSERTCPRCGAAREPGQDYCVECGLRLPPVTGRLASLRRGWLRRVGWYPGDWIWVSLPTLLVAVAGAVVAITLTEDGGASGGTTLVAASARLPVRGDVPETTSSVVLPSAPEPGAGTTTQRTTTTGSRTAPNGSLTWPESTHGWTIVLVSYPSTRGRAAPLATASRAAGLGLPEVGVLDSSDFSSLHPGYTIVFSGIYRSRADAEAALTSARASGFGSAYSREISR
jgi:hypothetical protein